MRRSHALPGLLALAAGLLSGCAGIPTSGEIRKGGPVHADDPAPYVRFYPPQPQVGDSETQLVEGWFGAMGAYDPGNRTSALYLSDKARSAWQPGAGTTVYDGPS